MAILRRGAQEGILPTNVACSVACRFCYERRLKREYKNIDYLQIPPYDNASFEFFAKEFLKSGKPFNPSSICYLSDRGYLRIGPNADFFTLGISLEQLDWLFRHSPRADARTHLYSTGLNLTPGMVRTLSARHGDRFILRVSAITFQDQLKKKLVSRWTDAKKVSDIIQAANMPRVMFMCFNEQQITEDLRILNELCSGGVRVIISVLFASPFYPEYIQRFSRVGQTEFRRAVEAIAKERNALSNIREMRFLFPPEALSWKFRYQLARLLRGVQPGDTVLCSVAAERVLRMVVKEGVHVSAVPTCARNNINIAAALTTKSLLDHLEQMDQPQKARRRVFLPSSIWWVEGRHDIEGTSIQARSDQALRWDIRVISVPEVMVRSTLRLSECLEYYRAMDSAVNGSFRSPR